VFRCQGKTLGAGTTTDCTYTDISGFKYFSYQIYCGETVGDSMTISLDWIGGSAASTAYMKVPTGVSQLLTGYTTEDAWSAITSIRPPVSPIGTFRVTESNSDDDVVCTIILNMGN
jgi:hypothetical protein